MKPDEDQEEMLVTYTLMQKKRPLTKFEEDLGVSSEYDRRIYDSPSARREFHESQFKGNKTTISSDGKVVHQSHKAAKNKYGKKHASLHQGEADHIDPLKNIHERVENNPLARLLLSDSDLQEVGNRRTNFQELSKGENTSKGAKSELQRGIETCDVKRVAKGISVQVETDVLLTNKAIQNAGKIFAKGAADALATSVIPLVIKGTQDLCHVANGDMTMKEATEDVGKLGGTILASGGTERLATWALGKALKDSENKVLKEFAKANQIGTILVVGSIVAKAAGKYLDGEIDGSGFISEIGQDGLSMISGMLASKAAVSLLGGATGLAPMAVPVLAAIVCVTDKSSTIEYLHKKELKAHILDFSLTESAASHPIEFNSADATWIYNTLIPYGLKLKTLKDQKISDPAPFDVQRAPSPLAEIACVRAFFQLCQKQNDCCCDTREVYQSYCQFLAATQNGRKTEFSKIQFNKKFREISKSKFIYKRPHRSRKGPSPYCYIGLKLPETFPKSEAAPSAPQEDCLMRYLKHIEKYQLTGQIKTTLDIPPAKK